MGDSIRLEQITLWLTKLALLTSGGKTPVTKQQIGLYALMCLEEVPINSFSDESLSFVANRFEFFPAYAVLQAALAEWQTVNPDRPRVAADLLSASLRDRIEELTDDSAHGRKMAGHRAAAKSDWSNPVRVRASVEHLQHNAAPGMRAILGRMLANLVRHHAPENLGFVPPEYHSAEPPR